MKSTDLVGDPPYPDMNAGAHYDRLMAHLERMDLLLQQRYYESGDSSPSHDFLLSEEEVLARLAEPQGRPVWASYAHRSSGAAPGDFSPAPPDLLGKLAERFELTDFDTQVVLLGLLPHFDSRYHALFSSLQGDKQKRLPTFELALTLFCDSGLERNAQQLRFLPESPLLKNQLLLTQRSGITHAESWIEKGFSTSSEVYHYLLGNSYLAPHLSAYAERVFAQGTVTQTASFATFFSRLQHALFADHGDTRPVVMLRGRQGSGRAAAITEIAAEAGHETLVLDMARLPEDDREAEQVCAQVFRYARMHDACVVLRSFSELAETRAALLLGLSGQLEQPGLSVACLLEPHSPLAWLQNIPQLLMEMPSRSEAEKADLLREWLAPFDVSNFDLDSLSRCFHFTPETLPSLVQEATFYQQLRDPDSELDQADLRKALRLRSQQNFGKLARRVEPRRRLDDLVVSDDLRQQLQEIIAAIKHREFVLKNGFADKVGYGTGISALFYGPSGTGKTMAAEVLAAQQGVDLIKIDLSTVVNKYIGETEKNLSRIFDLAEADAGALFFDEADALFGKRSETRDAKDRYANIEVSYLLQRLENYPGLVILATNNRGHLDDGFTRRFTFIARFGFPDATLRERMWRGIWPENIKFAENVDFHDLATRFNITGANIRNIALLSAWLAADEGSGVINVAHIETAIRREMTKAGRLVP